MTFCPLETDEVETFIKYSCTEVHIAMLTALPQ